MKAVVIEQPNQVSVRQIPDPTPDAGYIVLGDAIVELVITKGKKKGQHPSPATVLRMLREHDETTTRAQEPKTR